jgi:5-methylcytosine-specific restriction endonuclease McrA
MLSVRYAQPVVDLSDPRPPKRIKDPALLARLHLEYAGEPCMFCERRPGTQLHHIISRAQGGDDVRENLAWLCVYCHDEAHGIRTVT